MVDQIIDRICSTLSSKDNESLFVRTNDPTENPVQPVRPTETKDANRNSAGPKESDSTCNKGSEKSEDPLYISVMKDVRSLKDFGGRIVDAAAKGSPFGVLGIEKTVPSTKKGFSEEKDMLDAFELLKPGTAVKAARHGTELNKEKSSEVDTRHAAEFSHMLKNLDHEAYHSKDAAFVIVANNLADHPKLAEMVTNSAGQVNMASVDRALKIDAGATALAEKNGTPGPQELTPAEREALVTVRTHIGMITDAANALASGSRSGDLTAGLAINLIKGMNTGDIAKTLSDLKVDPKTASAVEAAVAILAAQAIRPVHDGLTRESKNSASRAGAGDAAHAPAPPVDRAQAAQPADRTHAAAPPADHTQAPAPPVDRTHAAAPPADHTQAPAPPVDRTHAAAPPADHTHAATPPADQPHAAAPPSDRTHAATPPADQPHAATPPADHSKPKDSPLERAPEQRENVAQIADNEFSTVAKQVLAKLDTNHTGEITKEQLVKALEDHSFKGKEAQALAAMYHSFDSLHNLCRHEGWTGSRSITAGDLDKYEEIQKTQNQRTSDAYEMKNWAHLNLSKFDKDHNGSLTRSEIAAALKDPQTSANDRKMLETVQKYYSEMGHVWQSGVNLHAFDHFAENIHKDSSNAKLVSEVWGICYNVNKGQKPDISHELYADRDNPLKSINPEAIKQGYIGDCYFESSLAAVAKAHPEMIRDAIKDNGNGYYTVTFQGDQDNPITIKAPTEAEQGLYNHGSPNGLWASVMEKAYGEYCQQHFWRRSPINLGGGNTPEEGADGGGRTAGAMSLLTGSDVSTNTTTFTYQSTMAANLERAFSSHPPKAVTAGINGALPFTDDETADKFYKGHAYSITGFVPDGRGGGMITIRNPWGGRDGPDGKITVPLSEFMRNFSDLSIEQ